MPRRIVPDNSVIIPAFFKETIPFRGNEFPLWRRASDLVGLIRVRQVAAVAPEHLVYEFMKAAHRKSTESTPIDIAHEQLLGFLQLWSQSIRPAGMAELAEVSWRLCVENQISPPDSWYLACAIINDAELWIATTDNRDHFADNARKVYPNVHVLTEESVN